MFKMLKWLNNLRNGGLPSSIHAKRPIIRVNWVKRVGSRLGFWAPWLLLPRHCSPFLGIVAARPSLTVTPRLLERIPIADDNHGGGAAARCSPLSFLLWSMASFSLPERRIIAWSHAIELSVVPNFRVAVHWSNLQALAFLRSLSLLLWVGI